MSNYAAWQAEIDRLRTELVRTAGQRDHFKERARLAEVHLRLRTAALVRIIARQTRFPRS